MRCIDADALKEELCKEYRHFDQRIKIFPVFQLIRDAPTIEPEQVCVANVTLTDEQVKEAVERVKSAVISVIKPDRKTGKWKKLYGYVIPGRNPVWCCPECGKGIHVFGIEHDSYNENIADHQWLSCPNCDAKMIGEEE